ncbi:MarR family winged helix-turn-helix transcriptional regulator [Levilactobacillus brevis]|uniref:MarR family winged helix-turn-helix transcriptional regulator n=1 Tax=Levilactobacillus brevis TaxID=1580 RepID=UPI00076057F8|nr:MarR family winged helix-turn-helix transcriptional regulator [Levilactobacillus brevis]KWT46878.1 transcriptional regulator [Levilactobacillus brevis]MBT9678375.1 MarR family transcriptional regulator [Levilactobacillus brevis]QWK88055.1 MarR family winged helix-turn-helix transcriptional regulator [Levilactobacillus brevis]RDF83884.1 MarR family transcriptional regulator [Levilactobacillus brevis]
MGENINQLLKWTTQLRNIDRNLNVVEMTSQKVTLLQFQLLHEIDQHTFDPGHFVERAGVSRSSISVRITNLMKRGWVTTAISEEDHRRHVLKLTEAGKEIHDDTMESVVNSIEMAYDGLQDIMSSQHVKDSAK